VTGPVFLENETPERDTLTRVLLSTDFDLPTVGPSAQTVLTMTQLQPSLEGR